MKKAVKYLFTGALFFVMLAPVQGRAGVDVYVRIAPPKVAKVKVVKRVPARPYRHAVWVAGHYQYKHGRYVWVSGRWIKGKAGFVYVQPHWQKTRHGWRYVTGHWVKK